MISIIMPAYNSENYIAEAIESVIGQTYTEWELLVIDDYSSDQTTKIIQKYMENDTRIQLIRKKQNDGVAVTRNIGIQKAKGEFIAFLDSDDVWKSNKLEEQLKLQRKTGAAIIYCSYDFVDENNKKILKPFIVPEQTDYKSMLSSSVISCSTALIDTKLLKQHMFEPDVYHEDYVLWMKLLKIPVKAKGCLEVLTHYRQVSGSRSNDKKNAAIQRWYIYRKVLKMGRVDSSIAFIKYAFKGVKKYYLAKVG